jgi:RNA polymerase sigma-70 factor (ECF subfamily)
MMQTLYRVSYAQLSQSSDRDDAVQECLYKAWKKRRHLKDDSVMQTWVIRILINECRNIQKKRKRELPLDVLPERATPPNTEVDLHNALFVLDETLLLPVLLHYVEGYSTKEVAQILRLPHGTVKSRMARARRELQKLLSWEVKEPCEI